MENAARSSKAPNRHRRTYEAYGQRWPTNLRKHLALAESSDDEGEPDEAARWARELEPVDGSTDRPDRSVTLSRSVDLDTTAIDAVEAASLELRRLGFAAEEPARRRGQH